MREHTQPHASPEKTAATELIPVRQQQLDPGIDTAWLEGAERRLTAYREERVRGIPAEDVVGRL